MANVVITSPSNPKIRALAALRDRSGRRSSGRFLIEGTRELHRAISAGVTFHEVAVRPDVLTPTEKKIVAQLVQLGVRRIDMGEMAFHKVAYRKKPGAVIGIAATPNSSLALLSPRSGALVLIVQGPEKPGNLGAMLRTADAAGVDAAVVAGPVLDLGNPNVIKASQGTVFSIPLAMGTITEVTDWAHSHSLTLIAGSDTANHSYWDASFDSTIGIVIGNEAHGLSAAWDDHVTKVRIPMAGSGDSLNAATAAALLLYEVARRRSLL